MAVEKTKPKRIRRTAEDAKNVILDAAEKRLRELGPSGIKLQELAADVGVSHPAILHHFGSRDGLVEAVVKRALASLQDDILTKIRKEMGREVNIPAILDVAFGILTERGHARLVAWLMLDGANPRDETRIMRALSEAAHVRMVSGGWTKGRQFEFEDMLFIVMLVASTAIGMGVVGEAMRHSSGVEDDPGVEDRFRKWLAALVARYLMGNGEFAAVEAPDTTD
ncbi:MAG: TetR/AcrR family transcriptional regulator [Candidatus Binatia bacterium]